ncbi:MAG: right-handed parallel beta-helix repeat-containing protein [Candidatus Azobacteroides sp.]|nr:right-handed parallel beta-helix repeat-containing protein [Candidatus Azobacteroides sp.]
MTKLEAIVRYVVPGGNGLKNGFSWDNASDNIQSMINISVVGDSVWVASGTYTPTHTANGWSENNPTRINTDPKDQNNSFVLKTGVKVFGGFVGGETEFRERNWIHNRTILSGDFDGNDYGNDSSHSNSRENAYHVVITANSGAGTVLDGFTIWGGNYYGHTTGHFVIVNGIEINNLFGGGIYAHTSQVSLRNLEIRRNAAPQVRGGLYCNNSPELRGYNLYFFKNFASQGGGLYVKGSPKFKNIIVSENEAGIGAGISNSGSDPVTEPHYINALIHSNLGSYNNGFGAGMQNERASPVITNSTIIGNYGGIGSAGIYNYQYSYPVINNSIIWNNRTADWYGNVEVNNVGYGWDSGATYNYSLLQGENLTETGGLDATSSTFDPMFIFPPAYAHNGGIGSFTLELASPCVNAGSNELYIEACGDEFLGWEKEYTLTPPPYTPWYDSFYDFFGAWYPRDMYSGKEALRLGGERINIGAFEATFIPPDIYAESWVYEDAPEIPYMDGEIDNKNIKYYYSGDPDMWPFIDPVVPSAIGTYYVQGLISGLEGYEPVRTSPVEFSIYIPEFESYVMIDDWTYGNKAVTPEVTSNPGEGEVTYYYGTSISRTFFSTTPPTDAGTYYVKAKIEKTPEYNELVTPAEEFTIYKAPQSIAFYPPSFLNIQDNPYILEATASSGLPVEFQVNDTGLAEIIYNELFLKQPGLLLITAYVEPDHNYEDAEKVSAEIKIISSESGIIITEESEKVQEGLFVAPNPVACGALICIDLCDISSLLAQHEPIEVYNTIGQLLEQWKLPVEIQPLEVRVDMPPGHYILKWKKHLAKLVVK